MIIGQDVIGVRGDIMIYKNFIGGTWIESKTASSSQSSTFENRNPAHKDKVIAEFQDSARVDVDFAVEVAHDAFKMWKNTPAIRLPSPAA